MTLDTYKDGVLQKTEKAAVEGLTVVEENLESVLGIEEEPSGPTVAVHTHGEGNVGAGLRVRESEAVHRMQNRLTDLGCCEMVS